MGARLETPQILNMVLRSVQALITYHSLAAGGAAAKQSGMLPEMLYIHKCHPSFTFTEG